MIIQKNLYTMTWVKMNKKPENAFLFAWLKQMTILPSCNYSDLVFPSQKLAEHFYTSSPLIVLKNTILENVFSTSSNPECSFQLRHVTLTAYAMYFLLSKPKEVRDRTICNPFEGPSDFLVVNVERADNGVFEDDGLLLVQVQATNLRVFINVYWTDHVNF